MDTTAVIDSLGLANGSGETFFNVINVILFVVVALGAGLWLKVKKGLSSATMWLNFVKEWLDVAFVFIAAIVDDATIDEAEKEAILKEWEEAKNSGKLPEVARVSLKALKKVGKAKK